MIKRAFNWFKNLKDIYKLWVFIISILATNGLQALMSGNSTDDIVEFKDAEVIVKVADVAPTAAVAAVAAVAKCGDGSVLAHEVEHHGGSHAKVRE